MQNISLTDGEGEIIFSLDSTLFQKQSSNWLQKYTVLSVISISNAN